MQLQRLLLPLVATVALASRTMFRGGDGVERAPKVCLPRNAVPGANAAEKCGHVAAFQVAFMQTTQPGWGPYPEEPAPYGYAERLSKKCEEPKNAPHSFDGAGPPVIYCCHTAQEKVAKFEEKEEHCDEDDLPVPCWKTLVKAIPTYLMYYRSRVADLCGTTTTTTTVSNATDSNATEADETQESIVKNVTGNVTSKDSLGESFTAFCLRKCEKMVVMKEGKSCDELCGVLNEKHEEVLNKTKDELKDEMAAGGAGGNCGGNGTAEAEKAATQEEPEVAKQEPEAKGNDTAAGNNTK